MRSPARLLGSAAVLLVLSTATPALAATVPAGPVASSATPFGTAVTTSATATVPRQLPPPAPRPTSTAISPDAPDPHPPAGGIGPLGEPVGGASMLTRGLLIPPRAPKLPANLTAAAWVLVDLDSGAVLAARDPHGRYQPASILKILTVDTLLPTLPGNQVVTVGADAAGTEGSSAGLVAGGRYTVNQLFSGLLLVSGNDAAMALADAAGGVPQTVAAMNAEAASLGAYDTAVQTPSGLDGWQQLTSAYDMALFLKTAVADPRFLAYDKQPNAVLPAQVVAGKTYAATTIANQGDQYFADVSGGFVAKTGYTDAAQHTYLAAASRNGRRLGVVFLRAQRWPIDQWQQAAELFNWGYSLPAATPAVGQLQPAVAITRPAAGAAVAAASRSTRPVAAAQVAGPDSFGTPRLVWAGLGTVGVLMIVAGLALGIADNAYYRRVRLVQL